MRYMITDEMWAVIEECLAQAKIENGADPRRFPTASSWRPCSTWRERGFPDGICPGNLGNGMRFTTGIVAGSKTVRYRGCLSCSLLTQS
jgi:hypothetical protein